MPSIWLVASDTYDVSDRCMWHFVYTENIFFTFIRISYCSEKECLAGSSGGLAAASTGEHQLPYSNWCRHLFDASCFGVKKWELLRRFPLDWRCGICRIFLDDLAAPATRWAPLIAPLYHLKVKNLLDFFTLKKHRLLFFDRAHSLLGILHPGKFCSLIKK